MRRFLLLQSQQKNNETIENVGKKNAPISAFKICANACIYKYIYISIYIYIYIYVRVYAETIPPVVSAHALYTLARTNLKKKKKST